MPTNSKDYMRQYYQDHKDNYRQKAHCELCGVSFCRGKLMRHQRSKTHRLAVFESGLSATG